MSAGGPLNIEATSRRNNNVIEHGLAGTAAAAADVDEARPRGLVGIEANVRALALGTAVDAVERRGRLDMVTVGLSDDSDCVVEVLIAVPSAGLRVANQRLGRRSPYLYWVSSGACVTE